MLMLVQTSHCGQRVSPGGGVVALDRSKPKVASILQTCARLGLDNVTAFVADGRKVVAGEGVPPGEEGAPPFPPCRFDRVLVDAPCSGLGQRPQFYNKMRIKELKSFPVLQRALLTSAVSLLRPGGVLVYSTCTNNREENEEVTQWASLTFPCLERVESRSFGHPDKKMSVDVFIAKCQRGDESEAKSMVERDPGLHNMKNSHGWTGLMWALNNQHHSLSRWLLSLPGLDTNLRDKDNDTALHWACLSYAPLDIVITLVRLSSWETVNMKTSSDTALDHAIESNNTSAALYLSWLGAECEEEYRKYSEVTLQTWIEAGCQQEAQYWAVAAKDINALKHLVDVENVKLDRPKLSKLAKLFDHREMWNYVTSLQSLTWERIKQTVPAVVNLLPEQLIEGGVAGPVAGVLVKMRNTEPEPESVFAESGFN